MDGRLLALAVIVLVLLVLVYLPVFIGKPVGWLLYAYWTLWGLVALGLAWADWRGEGA
ncbi:MAG: hypothetical protein F7C35_04570 [Desulfurococcales archaeon]|nr:hypothetical protein [Desulfurococcales archaeon]